MVKSIKKSAPRRIKYSKKKSPVYGRRVAICRSIKREKACLRRPECKYLRSKKRCSKRKTSSPLHVTKFSKDVPLEELRRGHKTIAKKSSEKLSALREKLLAKLAEKSVVEERERISSMEEPKLLLTYKSPKKSPKKAKKSVKKSRPSMKRSRKHSVEKRGRRVAVCGRYVDADVCESKLDCWYDEKKEQCRPRKGRSAQRGIRAGPMMPEFYRDM
jgi:hypothetical protein